MSHEIEVEKEAGEELRKVLELVERRQAEAELEAPDHEKPYELA